MEEPKWWSKAFVVSAVIFLFLLIAAPFAYKYQVSPLMTAFSTMLLAVVGAALVFLVGLGMTIYTNNKGMPRDRNLLLMAIGIALIPLIMVGPQISKGRSVPPIHDITTDTSNPPIYFEINKLRVETDNSLLYEYEGSAKALADLQLGAYPSLKAINSDLNREDAVARAADVLRDMGLEIVNMDKQSGIVEATATTFWFGFKDDVVVRIRAEAGGSLIDLRSASRVGQSDIGVNAARILTFASNF